MYKIVYNACYGGFGLSEKAVLRYCELKGIDVYPERYAGLNLYYLSPKTGDLQLDKKRKTFWSRDLERHDPILVQVVEELGKEASDNCFKLEICEIYSNQYRIDEYDGYETVKTNYDDSWIVI